MHICIIMYICLYRHTHNIYIYIVLAVLCPGWASPWSSPRTPWCMTPAFWIFTILATILTQVNCSTVHFGLALDFVYVSAGSFWILSELKHGEQYTETVPEKATGTSQIVLAPFSERSYLSDQAAVAQDLPGHWCSSLARSVFSRQDQSRDGNESEHPVEMWQMHETQKGICAVLSGLQPAVAERHRPDVHPWAEAVSRRRWTTILAAMAPTEHSQRSHPVTATEESTIDLEEKVDELPKRMLQSPNSQLCYPLCRHL